MAPALRVVGAHPRLTAALLVLLAFVLRAAWVAHTDPLSLTSDPSIYDRYAKRIAAEGYPARSELGVGPTADKPPLYPLFLGGIYAVAPSDQLAARLVQSGLGALTVALMGLLAHRIWGRRVALLTLALGATFPPLIVSSTSLITESLFVALMLAALVAVFEARRAARGYGYLVAAGVLGGLAVLTRTNGPLLVLALALLVWPKPRFSLGAIARPAVLAAVAVLTVAPWTIRNAIVMDDFVPVTTSLGETLAGTYNGTSERLGGYWIAPYELPEFGHYYDPPRFTEIELDHKLRADAVDYLRDHPVYALKVGVKNTLRMTGLSGDPERIIDLDQPSFPLGLGFGSFYVVCLLAIAGGTRRSARRAPAVLWGIPVAFWLSAIFIEGWVRFRAPIDPFVVLLAALAVEGVATGIGRGRRGGGIRPAG